MPATPRDYPTVDYDTHARTCAPDAFWAQVKRTVHGQPVSDAQITLIIQEIKRQLDLAPQDHLLDLACGNGALSQLLTDSCASLLGVDISAYLIEVAQKHFAQPPRVSFIESDVTAYLRTETDPLRFTKAVCYGSFMYFPDDVAHASLHLLGERFTNVQTVFIGNLPDRDRVDAFYTQRQPKPGELDDPQAQIGIWRTRQTFVDMAAAAGWETTFSNMGDEFYSTHYRYDALLRRPAPR